MTPPQQQKEYIITEDELVGLVNEDYVDDLVIDSNVRSRPYNEQAIREQVLEELDQMCYKAIIPPHDGVNLGHGANVAYKQVRVWIAVLRQQEREP